MSSAPVEEGDGRTSSDASSGEEGRVRVTLAVHTTRGEGEESRETITLEERLDAERGWPKPSSLALLAPALASLRQQTNQTLSSLILAHGPAEAKKEALAGPTKLSLSSHSDHPLHDDNDNDEDDDDDVDQLDP